MLKKESKEGALSGAEVRKGSKKVVRKTTKKESSKDAKGRGKATYHHGDLRRALMEEGLRILTREGAEHLNLRELARRLGVSHAAPYRHFASREELVEAIALEGAKTFSDYLLKEVHRGESRSPMDAFSSMGRGYVRFAADHPDLYRFVFMRESICSVPGSETERTMEGTSIALEEAVRKLQEAGLLRPGDPQLISIAIWSFSHGFSSLYIDGRLPVEEAPEDYLMRMMQLLLRGIAF